MRNSELTRLLPWFKKTGIDNYYIIVFLLDAWALLTVIGKISRISYENEYQNLKALYENLLLSLDKSDLILCLKILDALEYIEENNTPVNRKMISAVLLKCDDFMFVNIHFRAGVITRELSMYHDFLNTGAFGYSPAIDLIKYLEELSPNLRTESIIDLGSGNGLPVCLFSQLIDDVTGVELNQSLVDESIDTIKNLSALKRINSASIKIIHDSFFNVNLSCYSIIYICWPFDNKDKAEHEEKMRSSLSIKIKTEAKKGTKIIVFLPGISEKDLFPGLKQISGMNGEYSSMFYFYIMS